MFFITLMTTKLIDDETNGVINNILLKFCLTMMCV